MKRFKKYKVILWDFDGVIEDSMAVRDLGFVRVLENSGFEAEDIGSLLAYHRANGGLSRYVKFRYFYEVILGQEVAEADISVLASSFSEIMLSLLINKDLLIQDTVDFIKSHYETFEFHIVSGSDGQELNKICNGLHLDSYFHSIGGSPTAKTVLISNLIRDHGYLASEICLIGDSINDYDAAVANGIDFFGYNNTALEGKGSYIASFKSIV